MIKKFHSALMSSLKSSRALFFLVPLVVLVLLFNALLASRAQPLSTIPPTVENRVCSTGNVYKTLEETTKVPNKVYELDLSNNCLTQLPPQVLELTELRELYLNFNEISHLPVDITGLSKLELLDLTGNPLSQDEIDKIRQHLPNVDVIFIKPMHLPSSP